MTTNVERVRILPTEEEWDFIRKIVEANEGKIVFLDFSVWHNTITRRKGKVECIPIMALNDDGGRPIIVTRFTLKKKLTREEFNALKEDETSLVSKQDKTRGPLYYNSDAVYPVQEWVFNEFYSHTNISGSLSNVRICTEEKDGLLEIEYQALCSPITQHHFYNKPLDQLTLICKGQLTGQNGNSAFQEVAHVENGLMDRVLVANCGRKLKRTESLLSLLTRKLPDTLQEMLDNGTLGEELAGLKSIPTEELPISAKLRHRSEYSRMTQEEFDDFKDKGEVSEYYPVIKYSAVSELLNNIPKAEKDIAFLGLGSAGTGILDQISRTTFFKSFVLCDMDRVERKNCRNQWYHLGDVSSTKVDASSMKLVRNYQGVNGTSPQLKTYNRKFQEAGLENLKFKYVVSSFDSIKARLDLFYKIKDGSIETKYLIDTRYDDLTSSIFFIDVENKEEMDYYEKGLLEAKEVFNKIEEEKEKELEIKNFNDYWAYLEQANVLKYNCMAHHIDLNISRPNDGLGCKCICGTEECKAHFKRVWNESSALIMEKLKLKKPAEESSCVRNNFIDIYKYTSAFVFSGIRELEADEPKKLFTQVDCTTDGMPHSMVLKK